jgi:hypothetical protein
MGMKDRSLNGRSGLNQPLDYDQGVARSIKSVWNINKLELF